MSQEEALLEDLRKIFQDINQDYDLGLDYSLDSLHTVQDMILTLGQSTEPVSTKNVVLLILTVYLGDVLKKYLTGWRMQILFGDSKEIEEIQLIGEGGQLNLLNWVLEAYDNPSLENIYSKAIIAINAFGQE